MENSPRALAVPHSRSRVFFSITFDSLNGFSNICNLDAMISVGEGLESRTSVGEGDIYGDATHIQVHAGLWP